jgi:2-polyprenyl-3-methyl-5-hydroxy-6-metoxy-1,4-benzoquinol methylase
LVKNLTDIKNLPSEFYDFEDSENSCFFCAEPDYSTVYTIKHYGFPFHFQKCQCGIIKQTPLPNKKFFEWFFNSELFYSAKKTNTKKIWGFYDYFKDEVCRLSTSRFRYKKLKKVFNVNQPLEILKIGPSTGTFLYVANQNKHHAIGCDVSSEFVQYAKKNYNVRIDCGRFEHLNYKDGQFDVILLFNVIENIPNIDEFLRNIDNKLKPGGHFILNHVDMMGNLIAKWQREKYFLFRPPICYIYNKELLIKVLKKYGFDAIAVHRDYRFMHFEKIFTLLDINLFLSITRLFRLHRFPFPIYAYPSKIIVFQKSVL